MKFIPRILLFIFSISILMNPLLAQWVQTGGPDGSDCEDIVVIGTDIYTETVKDIFLSNNEGTTWSRINTGMTSNIYCLAAIDTNLFIGTDDGLYLLTKNDSGWMAINKGISGTTVRTVAISKTHLLAGTDNGIFLSNNNGLNWTNVLPTFFVSDFAISGSNLFAGTGEGVFLSTI